MTTPTTQSWILTLTNSKSFKFTIPRYIMFSCIYSGARTSHLIQEKMREAKTNEEIEFLDSVSPKLIGASIIAGPFTLPLDIISFGKASRRDIKCEGCNEFELNVYRKHLSELNSKD